jgi:uncharacterized protein DUF4230
MQHLTGPLATNPKSRPRLLTCIGIILALIIALLVLALFGRFFKIVPQSSVVIPLPDNVTVITQIRNIGRLETVSYTLEKVIPYDQDSNSIWRFLGNHTKLFIVHGEVIAGFDLTRLSKDNVKIQGTAITINLPPPQILETNLDEAQTRTYDVTQGPLGLFPEGLDSNTELQILAAAKISLKDDACKGDILQKASDNARQQFTSFLIELGFKTVTINIPSGTC